MKTVASVLRNRLAPLHLNELDINERHRVEIPPDRIKIPRSSYGVGALYSYFLMLPGIWRRKRIEPRSEIESFRGKGFFTAKENSIPLDVII